MALGKKSDGPRAVYLQVKAKTGEMTRWVRGTEGGEGHEEEVPYVTGVVNSVEVHEKTWPDNSTSYELHVGLKDPVSNERYFMTMGVENRMAGRLVAQLNALDLTKEHYFRPYLIKEGDKMQDGSVATGNTALFSVKPVLSAEGDKLDLGEGVRPFFGEGIERLPAGEPMVNGKGQPVMQNNKQVVDYSERNAMISTLIAGVQAKLAALKGPAQQQGQGDDGDGIDPDEAVAAATANRMRSNG